MEACPPLASQVRSKRKMNVMTPQTSLSTTQAQVVKSFSQGATVIGAASAVGIHRSTIYEWIKTQQEFADAVREARDDYRASLNDHRCELSRIAFFCLRNLLEDPKTPPAVRARLALAILDRYHIVNDDVPQLALDGTGLSDISDMPGMPDDATLRQSMHEIFNSLYERSDTSDTSDT